MVQFNKDWNAFDGDKPHIHSLKTLSNAISVLSSQPNLEMAKKYVPYMSGLDLWHQTKTNISQALQTYDTDYTWCNLGTTCLNYSPKAVKVIRIRIQALPAPTPVLITPPHQCTASASTALSSLIFCKWKFMTHIFSNTTWAFCLTCMGWIIWDQQK